MALNNKAARFSKLPFDGLSIGQADDFNHIDLTSQNFIESNIAVNPSRLLSLPKELRLEIWQYALIDVARDKLVLRIQRRYGPFTRGKRFCNSLNKHPKLPEIDTRFEKSLSSPLGNGLLGTNHFIYSEALPILYENVVFCIWDIEGIFPLFLERLSSFAQSCIRFIRLVVDQVYDKTSSIFYWALTCAQVAKLAQTLRSVEVQGTWPIADHSTFIRQAILSPLVKLRAPKRFVNKPDCHASYEDDFQRLLEHAAEALKAKADLRRALTTADILKRRKIENLNHFDGEYPPQKRQRVRELPTRGGPTWVQQSPLQSDEGLVARDLAAITGINQFRQELLGWDMVSARSGSPTPPPVHSSDTNEENLFDNTSTINLEQRYDESSNKDVDDWELVDKPSTP